MNEHDQTFIHFIPLWKISIGQHSHKDPDLRDIFILALDATEAIQIAHDFYRQDNAYDNPATIYKLELVTRTTLLSTPEIDE